MTSPSPAAGEGGGAAAAPAPPPHPIRSGDGGGILLAVATSSGITTLAWCGYGLFEAPEAGLWLLVIAPAIFAITFAIGIIISALVGLPVVYLLTRLGIEGAWSYSLAGALAGAGVICLLLGFPADPTGVPLMLGAGPGLLTGWIWWRYRRRHQQYSGDISG